MRNITTTTAIQNVIRNERTNVAGVVVVDLRDLDAGDLLSKRLFAKPSEAHTALRDAAIGSTATMSGPHAGMPAQQPGHRPSCSYWQSASQASFDGIGSHSG